MHPKLFTDRINVFGKVADRVKAIANLPKAVRGMMLQMLSIIYRLIDTTLNWVIIRLPVPNLALCTPV